MKKTITAFFLFASFFLLSPALVSAHLVGQPPFFRLDGVYSILYSVPVSSVPSLVLPQDIANKSFLVNQKINFEFDLNAMPAPPDVIKKTRFTWDFGDGNKAAGLTNSHAYSKAGSYIMVVYADDGSTPEPQVIQSTFINILPNPNYKLPQSVISVNGKSSRDPLVDTLKLNFDNPLEFDGTKSKAGSGKIVSYFWDFGDQTSVKQSKTSHNLQTSLYQVFPVLRVTDENGFISDSFVELQNERLVNMNPANKANLSSPNPTAKPKVQNSKSNLPLILASLSGVLVIIYFTVRWYLRGHGRGRNR